MNYFTRTAHWRSLSPTDESDDNTTNLYFKNTCVRPVLENKA